MQTANTILLGSMIYGCVCFSGYSDSSERDNTMKKIVSANNTFGFNVFQQLVEKSMSENIFMSPASLSMALSMTYNGASGKTQEAMARVLELQGMSLEEVNQASAALMERLRNLGEDIRLDMANSLWAREGEEFKADFLKRNEEFYGAKISTLDFSDPKAPSIG
jgi:serine protease inhibitor